MKAIHGLLAGAAAGAAGTTALNAVTFLDMALRARPPSSTPERSVEKMASKAHLPIPGTAEQRANRLGGLGPLTGVATGVGLGAVLGLVHAAGWRPSNRVLAATAGLAAMLAGNGPMTVLGVSDPRTWSTADWLSDLVPHAAYGLVTASTLVAIDGA